MAFDRPVQAREAACSTAAPAVAAPVALGSAAHGGLGQMPPRVYRFFLLGRKRVAP